MRRVLGLAAALVFLAISVAPSAAQKDAEATGAISSSAYIGVWNAVIDWRGLDNATARWEFRGDGTFVDAVDDTGTWSLGGDGSITFQYPNGGHALYTGAIVGGKLIGTVTTGDYNGAFTAWR